MSIKTLALFSISPANLTIDWGAPGSAPYVAKGAQLSTNIIASHRYANKGDYTVAITTDEVDLKNTDTANQIL